MKESFLSLQRGKQMGKESHMDLMVACMEEVGLTFVVLITKLPLLLALIGNCIRGAEDPYFISCSLSLAGLTEQSEPNGESLILLV